jgi:hypothetical protein
MNKYLLDTNIVYELRELNSGWKIVTGRGPRTERQESDE